MTSRPSTAAPILARWSIGLIAAFFAIILIPFACAIHVGRQLREEETRRRNEWLQEQLMGLRSGKQSDIWFYDTSGTDDLLSRFRNMSEVEELTFELTDVTKEGLKDVRLFPNLRHLVLYGGSPGVDDLGFTELQGHPALEELELVNTNVTDAGLSVLATLPNLKRLALYREDFRPTTFTDIAIKQLQGLKQLKKLEVSGGWISTDAVQQLKDALPDCTISTKGHWG